MYKTFLQEEDHDDLLRLDQRTIGNLDGPQVHWNYVNIKHQQMSNIGIM